MKTCLSIMAPNYKNPKVFHGQRDKLWYIHTMECYVTRKKKKLQMHDIIWMNLKLFLKAIYYVVLLLSQSRTGEIIGAANRSMVTGVTGERISSLEKGLSKFCRAIKLLCILVVVGVKSHRTACENGWYYGWIQNVPLKTHVSRGWACGRWLGLGGAVLIWINPLMNPQLNVLLGGRAWVEAGRWGCDPEG